MENRRAPTQASLPVIDWRTHVRDAVAAFRSLKEEHKDLLQRVMADQGMAQETRTTLVAHLLEEEDEHLERIASAASRGDRPEAAARGRPTVGSLRCDATGGAREFAAAAEAGPRGFRLGSLRGT